MKQSQNLLPAIAGHYSARSIGSDKELDLASSSMRASMTASKRALLALGVSEGGGSVKQSYENTATFQSKSLQQETNMVTQ